MNITDIQAAKEWDKSKVFVIDTETTGLKDNDEVLSVSIVDIDGNTLFDEIIKPAHRKSWPEAQKINSIAPADVKDKKLLVDYENELKPYFEGDCLLVGYNITFDTRMLEQSGARLKCHMFDVMDTYSQIYGEWSEWKQERKWCKLIECANHYNYGEFAAHGSLADAKATAYCFNQLCEDKAVLKYWRDRFDYKGNETHAAKLERIKRENEEKENKQYEEQQKKYLYNFICIVIAVFALVIVAFLQTK